MDSPTPANAEQSDALIALGLKSEQIPAFLNGQAVVYPLPTESEPCIAVVQRVGLRLRSGIVDIRDRGGGLKTFFRFRGQSLRIARLFGLTELELFGAALINARLQQLLLNQGFERRVERCPDDLGDEDMEIVTRVYPVE